MSKTSSSHIYIANQNKMSEIKWKWTKATYKKKNKQTHTHTKKPPSQNVNNYTAIEANYYFTWKIQAVGKKNLVLVIENYCPNTPFTVSMLW